MTTHMMRENLLLLLHGLLFSSQQQGYFYAHHLTHMMACTAAFVTPVVEGARCSSVVRAFAHGAMGRRIDPMWWTH